MCVNLAVPNNETRQRVIYGASGWQQREAINPEEWLEQQLTHTQCHTNLLGGVLISTCLALTHRYKKVVERMSPNQYYYLGINKNKILS